MGSDTTSAGVPGIIPNLANSLCFYSKSDSGDTPVQCFFDFCIPLSSKHLVLRALLEDCLPEMLSKLGVLHERGMKKYKKHCTGVSPESLLL